MTKITKYTEVDVETTVDAEIEIEIEDVLDFIEQANAVEIEKIKDVLQIPNKIGITNGTLAETLKYELLVELGGKYTYDELQKLLK